MSSMSHERIWSVFVVIFINYRVENMQVFVNLIKMIIRLDISQIKGFPINSIKKIIINGEWRRQRPLFSIYKNALTLHFDYTKLN